MFHDQSRYNTKTPAALALAISSQKFNCEVIALRKQPGVRNSRWTRVVLPTTLTGTFDKLCVIWMEQIC